MATEILALNSSSIRYAEFVRLTMPTETITYCNAASDITVDGITFMGMSNYLGISEIQRDIKASSVDLRVSLNGLDPNIIALVLSSNIKGSTIEIWRGFLDDNNQILTIDSVQQFFKRYQGIINNIAINETFDDSLRQRVALCVVSCSSMRTILDNRVAGIKTNPQNWKFLYPNDTSMDRVPVIASTYFDFGKAPMGGSQSAPAAGSNVYTPPVQSDGGA